MQLAFTCEDGKTLKSYNHNLSKGDIVVIVYQENPFAFLTDTIYFVQNITTDTFQLSVDEQGKSIYLGARERGFVSKTIEIRKGRSAKRSSNMSGDNRYAIELDFDASSEPPKVLIIDRGSVLGSEVIEIFEEPELNGEWEPGPFARKVLGLVNESERGNE